MLLKYFYDDKLAQASYLLACPKAGEAIVIDPARYVKPYLQAAEQQELAITGVLETHIHADFISGARELAYHSGATIYLSGMGEGELAYAFPAADKVHFVHDGDRLRIGEVRLDVLHTHGHTPEHIALQVTDAGADRPVGLFTGDCLFVGDVGRPDLLEEAVKIAGTKEAGARQQYANVQRFKYMPDYLLIWPGHGAGTACGKNLSALPSSTLGYEKLVNPAFSQPDEPTFVRWLLEGQPEVPRYFGHVKQVNRVGAPLLGGLTPVHKLDESMLPEVLQHDNAQVLDARRSPDYVVRHLPGTLYVPGSENGFSTWTGWYIDYDRPTYLIAEESEVARLVSELRAIGLDDIAGYFTPQMESVKQREQPIAVVDVQTAAQKQAHGDLILDVRGRGERDSEYIPESLFIPMGEVPERIVEIPREQPVIVQCGGGRRSQVVASLLHNQGYDVYNMAGGIDAWIRAGLPLVSS